MNSIYSINPAMEQVNLFAKLAEIKDDHYRNTLALSTVIELLVEKGYFTREEVAAKANELDRIIAYLPDPIR